MKKALITGITGQDGSYLTDVYEYLNYLLTELPELGYAYKEAPEIIDKYLPWSDQLPEEVQLKQKRKKCVEK